MVQLFVLRCVLQIKPRQVPPCVSRFFCLEECQLTWPPAAALSSKLDPTSLSCPYICCILSGYGDCQLTLRKGLRSLPSLTHTLLVSVSLLKDSLWGHCHPQHALTVKEVLIVLLGLLGSWAPERGRIFSEIRIGEASPRLTK